MQSGAQLVEERGNPTMSSRKVAPGPRRHMLSFLLFGSPRDALNLYMEAARQYGDVVRFQMGPWFAHFVSHPDHVKHVLQENGHNYRRSIFFDLIKPLVGDGLLTSEGDFWRRQRRLMQPAFHRQRIAQFANLMTETTAAMLERWQQVTEGQPLNVASEMMQLTLSIVSKTLVSTDIGGEADEVGRAVTTALEHINYRSRYPLSLPEWVPTPGNLRFRRAVRTLDHVVYAVINERRRSGKDLGDLLSMLLLAKDEETGEGMTDKHLRDEVMTFVLAGHETTAITLAWTWYMLSKHPAVERRVRAEVAEVLNGRTPTVEDLRSLTYTRMVIEEVMRLYPPAWALSRNTISTDEIGGYTIPANSLVLLSPYVTHRHPDFWENPEGFDPERFTPEHSAERPRYAYFPFGGGQRQCIGNEFAMMEAQLIVAQVVQQYRIDLVPGITVEPDPIFTLRPRSAVLMTIHPVRGVRRQHDDGGRLLGEVSQPFERRQSLP